MTTPTDLPAAKLRRRVLDKGILFSEESAMSTTQTTDHRDSTKPTELKHQNREFATTSFSEFVMYMIAIGLVVGLGLLFNSGIE